MLKTIRDILLLYPKYNGRHNFYGLILCTVIIALGRVYEPFFIKRMIDLMQSWMDHPINITAFIDMLLVRGVYIIVMILGRFIIMLWYKKYLLHVYNGEYLRTAKITHTMPFGEYLSQSKSAFAKIVFHGVEAVRNILSQIFREYIYQLVTVVGVIVVMFSVNRRLALLTLCMMPLMLRITMVMDPKTFRLQKELDAYWDSGFSIIGDSMTNMGTIKTFTLEDKRTQAVADIIGDAFTRQKPLQRRWSLHDTYMQIIVMSARLIVVGGGVRMYTKGLTSISEIVLYFTYINFTYYPIMMMMAGLDRTVQQLVAYDKRKALMHTYEQQQEIVTIDKEILSGDVLFHEVNFSYVSEKQILQNISFSVPAGNKVALVGHTGAGKSTIAHLLLRFWEVTQGHISRGGKNIQDIGLGTLRQHIGVIMQDTTLFNTSVYNNLLRCMPSSWEELPEEEKHARLKTILQQAQADFVLDMPEGRDTVIGERGLKLSGGEKQRIALARLLLKNPELVILDEATSALDNTTEFQIKQVIDTVFAEKTMLIIAHRLSTVQQADRIIVLDAGRIVEQGTYDDLITQHGALRQLANPEDISLP